MVPTPHRMALAHDCTLCSLPLLLSNIGSGHAEWSLFPSVYAVAWGAFLPGVVDVHSLHPGGPFSLPLLLHGLICFPSCFFPMRDMPSIPFVLAFADLLLSPSPIP